MLGPGRRGRHRRRRRCVLRDGGQEGPDYTRNSQLVHYYSEFAPGFGSDHLWYLVEKILGVKAEGASLYECQIVSDVALTIPQDALRSSTYLKSVNNTQNVTSDIFVDNRPDEELHGTVYYKVLSGTADITDILVEANDPGQVSLTLALSNFTKTADGKFNRHKYCPLIP